MQAASSSSSSRATGSPPGGSGGPGRSNMLHRGEACFSCRRRKMKCDAGRPSCAPCTRAGRADQCEYEETRYLVAIAGLEEQVRTLQARVRELESSTSVSATLPAIPPARNDPRSASGSHFVYPTAPPPPPYPNQTVHIPPQQPTHDWTLLSPDEQEQDVPPAVRQQLITHFLQHAHEHGLPQNSFAHLGHHAALTAAAYAWASSAAAATAGSERTFVLRAETALARAAANPDARDVQAAALLASLAFARGRTMEGHRHLGAAMQVARALALREADPLTWSMLLRIESENAGAGAGDAWRAGTSYTYE